jgi:hypothetical protein
MQFDWVSYFGLSLLGLLLMHGQKLLGVNGAAVGWPVLGAYFSERAVNLIFSFLICCAVFYLAWGGGLSAMGWAGGASIGGGYIIIGYLSEVVFHEITSHAQKKVEGANDATPPSVP